MSKQIWVRIHPKQELQKFFRCGMQFGREWPQEPIEADEATAKRLQQEQMLEVTDTDPNQDTVSDASESDAGGGGNVATPPEDDAARLAAIKDAIGKLDNANPDLWLKDGKPATEAIAAITGWPVTAADRNTVWADIQPAASGS